MYKWRFKLIMRCVLCDDCPILNRDVENPAECNLGYTVELENLVGYRESYYHSKDCKLESIKSSNGLFFPEWIEAEVVEREPVECPPFLAKKLIEESLMPDIFENISSDSEINTCQ